MNTAAGNRPCLSLKRACLSTIATALLVTDAAPASELDDGEFPLTAAVTITTDYVFRGVSQTLGGPAIQASLDLPLENGFYGYVWGSNVDFRPADEPDDGARSEINIAAGYVAELGNRWSLDISVVRYWFPGTDSAVDYDYNELISSVRFDDRLWATFGYSNAVDGTDAPSRFSEVGYRFTLPSKVTFEIAYGNYDLSKAYGSAYAYTKATVARSFASAELNLSYFETFGEADQIFYEQAIHSRIVASLLVAF